MISPEDVDWEVGEFEYGKGKCLLGSVRVTHVANLNDYEDRLDAKRAVFRWLSDNVCYNGVQARLKDSWWNGFMIGVVSVGAVSIGIDCILLMCGLL